MTIAPGSRVQRYEVGAPLGAGGMGQVFLARDVDLDRTVALKVLIEGAGERQELVRRFVQEAKAAVALNHPNIAHVYDVGEQSGERWIAMEYVEGETLRQRMERGALPFGEALEIATQIVAAIGSAHAAGIVHRDIKPENVMIRPDGYVKVLDFGLAKITKAGGEVATLMIKTAPGLVMGTMLYMSPEQLRGEEVDARTDVFSLGVLLYELFGGRRPFDAPTPSGIIAAILTEEPAPLVDVPDVVSAVVSKALAKNRDGRHRDARELHGDLKLLRADTHRIRSGDVPTQILTQAVPAPRRRWLLPVVVAIAVIALAAAGIAYVLRERRIAESRKSLATVEKLAAERKYFEADDLLDRIAPDLAGEPRVPQALANITAELTLNTDPPGARVSLTRVQPGEQTSARESIGITPLAAKRVPRGEYLVTIEKDGYASATRPISLSPTLLAGGTYTQIPLPPIEVKLIKATELPAGMVYVPGGPYRLVGADRPTQAPTKLQDFFIDRTEVSQREFAAFIADGGYRRPELWKHPIVHDGKTLAFHDAMQLFRDTNGLPGPRNWSAGKPAAGHEDHPVTGVTWYEAAAFAEWRGKRLPTVYEWDKAARNGVTSAFGPSYPWGVVGVPTDVTERANFRGAGTMPVDSLPFGMSVFGALHLAGNVSEWCANAWDDGYVSLGGSSDDAVYAFSRYGGFPGLYASPLLGFRCAKTRGAAAGDQGAVALRSEYEVPKYTPVSDAEFAKLVRIYEYDRNMPLDAKVVERIETEEWTREKVTYAVPGGKRGLLYLYLPKKYKRPLQVIHFGPAGDVTSGLRSLPKSIEQILAPAIRSGRAVLGVVLEGYIERDLPAGWELPDVGSVEFAEWTAHNITDMRRALDYVATRPDLDASRIGYMGPSAGSFIGVMVTAVDARYRSVLFSGAGLRPSSTRVHPAANRVNFAPHIRAQKLMMAGRWDESHPLRTEAEPLFALLRQPKKLMVFDGSHIPPFDLWVRTINQWFDETMGPVQ